MITKVQIALMVRGYDPGPAKGVLSDATKAALSLFQTSEGLPASGFMDLATLRRLGVDVAMRSN